MPTLIGFDANSLGLREPLDQRVAHEVDARLAALPRQRTGTRALFAIFGSAPHLAHLLVLAKIVVATEHPVEAVCDTPNRP